MGRYKLIRNILQEALNLPKKPLKKNPITILQTIDGETPDLNDIAEDPEVDWTYYPITYLNAEGELKNGVLGDLSETYIQYLHEYFYIFNEDSFSFAEVNLYDRVQITHVDPNDPNTTESISTTDPFFKTEFQDFFSSTHETYVTGWANNEETEISSDFATPYVIFFIGDQIYNTDGDELYPIAINN